MAKHGPRVNYDNAGHRNVRRRRATRQAQQEALARARAKRIAEERRRQTIIGASVVVIALVIIAVIGGVIAHNVIKKRQNDSLTTKQAYALLQQVKTKPANANKDGGFLISRDGYNKKIQGVPTIEIFMDPMCPGCGALHQQVGSTFKKLVDAGQVNMIYHPMNFEDSFSTDKYSTRAAGAMTYIASHDPDPNHLLGYVDNIYDKDFQPEEGDTYQPVSNDQLKGQALKAGVPSAIADKAFAGTYNDWLTASYKYTVKRPELWNQSGKFKGSMTTPTIVINNKTLDMNEIDDMGISQKSAILESIGLGADEVGAEGQLPSIGSTGKPLDLES